MVNRRISNEARDNETCLVLRGGKLTLHGPDIIHKSSKELYRAVAKQCGITCKMSDHCRCFDCQVKHFNNKIKLLTKYYFQNVISINLIYFFFYLIYPESLFRL